VRRAGQSGRTATINAREAGALLREAYLRPIEFDRLSATGCRHFLALSRAHVPVHGCDAGSRSAQTVAPRLNVASAGQRRITGAPALIFEDGSQSWRRIVRGRN
jgi:hypothetical protein